MRNNNQKMIRTLSARSLRQNRMRNLFAIAAIALTTILFTGLFTVGQGIIQLQEEQTMRQVGTKAHSGLKGVTLQECEKIVDNPLVVDWDYHRILGFVENEEFSKRQVQLEQCNKKYIKNSFYEFVEGRLPESEDEVVLDDITLTMLGIVKKLGTKVNLKFDFLDQSYQETFTLCGWYKGDKVAGASSIYISEVYFEKICDGRTDEDLREISKKKRLNANGLIQADVYFKDSKDIEGRVCKIIKDAGFVPGENDGEIDYGVNWAYTSTHTDSMDPFTMLILIIIILLILSSGYLIIYNIFQISILKDIRFYGLLKTIGTTKRQISRLIRRQAILLSFIGIPIGLCIGYLIGLGLIPTIFSMGNLKYSNFHMQFHPFIFIFSIVFSILTVTISCLKPGRIAGKVSPVEATRYEEVKLKVKGSKKRRNFGITSMAYSNLKRNKKKTVLVVLSLCLSVIIVVEIVTFSRCFSISMYLKDKLMGDLTVATSNLLHNDTEDMDYKIDDDSVDYFKTLDGVQRVDEMYCAASSNFHYLSDTGYENYRKEYEQGHLNDVFYTHDNIESVLKDRASIDEVRYAYCEELLSKLTVLEGSIDIEKFKTGRYILVGVNTDYNMVFYHPGDLCKLQFQTESSEFEYDRYIEGIAVTNAHYTNVMEKEYEVMAVVKIPASMTTESYSPNALYSIFPMEEFLKMDQDAILFRLGILAKEGMLDTVEENVKNYTQGINPRLDYVSKLQLEEEFSSMTSGFLILGGAIAGVIALIGILNFLNSMITSVITRKRELAMLQSIGLTDSQLKKMLIVEGMSYIGLAMGVSIVIGSLISVAFVRALNRIVACFEYHFVYSPYLWMLPFFLIIAYVVPCFAYRNVQKNSLIERLS